MDYNVDTLPQRELSIAENTRRIRARRAEELEALEALGGSCIIDNVEIAEMHRRGTRLDFSRILQADEDNPRYGIF